MNIKQHKNVPRRRASGRCPGQLRSETVLARRFGVTASRGQEVIVAYLRQALLLALGEVFERPRSGLGDLAITREFLCPAVSRSGLDCCLRRPGVGNWEPLRGNLQYSRRQILSARRRE